MVWMRLDQPWRGQDIMTLDIDRYLYRICDKVSGIKDLSNKKDITFQVIDILPYRETPLLRETAGI
jgi:uncharacterized protein (DUF2267 family)